MQSEFGKKTLRITESLYPELRRPLGVVVRDPGVVVAMIRKRKREKTILVGDCVARALINDVDPDIVIVDNKIMRKPIPPVQVQAQATIIVRNPRSHITRDSWNAIRMAVMSDKRVKIVVEGEEDLLVLPAIELAPTGSAVIYGQPGEGLVIVDVDAEARERGRQLMMAMVPRE